MTIKLYYVSSDVKNKGVFREKVLNGWNEAGKIEEINKLHGKRNDILIGFENGGMIEEASIEQFGELINAERRLDVLCPDRTYKIDLEKFSAELGNINELDFSEMKALTREKITSRENRIVEAMQGLNPKEA